MGEKKDEALSETETETDDSTQTISFDSEAPVVDVGKSEAINPVVRPTSPIQIPLEKSSSKDYTYTPDWGDQRQIIPLSSEPANAYASAELVHRAPRVIENEPTPYSSSSYTRSSYSSSTRSNAPYVSSTYSSPYYNSSNSTTSYGNRTYETPTHSSLSSGSRSSYSNHSESSEKKKYQPRVVSRWDRTRDRK
jgi:hypothetical protein